MADTGEIGGGESGWDIDLGQNGRSRENGGQHEQEDKKEEFRDSQIAGRRFHANQGFCVGQG